MFRGPWGLIEAAPPITSLAWGAIGVVLHEITGAGYFGTLLLLGGVWGAFRSAGILGFQWPPEGRAFYALWAVTPLALAPLADVAFNHFFAIRQVIFVLPPLLLLFALGAESLGKAGKALFVVFIAAALYEDVSWMTKPREDWQAAASAASSAVAGGACVVFVPSDAFRMFEYFDPQLKRRQCTPGEGGRVILAISPYGPEATYLAARENLIARGYVKESEKTFHGPRVELYRVATSP
jgi:hypothetical protein